jgi:ABC-2 type transport system permease protein
MSRLASLAGIEARLLTRDWTVLVFAFLFPVFCMVVLAGVFGDQPDSGFGDARPDDYYVVASLGVPVIALCLVGLPVSLASYRERGVLRRLEAFGVPVWRVVLSQALVTAGLVVAGAAFVLALAAVTYGVPAPANPGAALLGAAAGLVTLLALGIAVGLAVPTARAAQAVGLLAFFPLYLLGGGGPPRGVMTGPMQDIASALPTPIPAISDPWLGAATFSGQLAALVPWAAAAILAAVVLARRAYRRAA